MHHTQSTQPRWRPSPLQADSKQAAVVQLVKQLEVSLLQGHARGPQLVQRVRIARGRYQQQLIHLMSESTPEHLDSKEAMLENEIGMRSDRHEIHTTRSPTFWLHVL